jgi:hypothetical protein
MRFATLYIKTFGKKAPLAPISGYLKFRKFETDYTNCKSIYPITLVSLKVPKRAFENKAAVTKR